MLTTPPRNSMECEFYHMAYKTLAHLNSKWWYRLIKVLYVLSFIFLLVIANFETYNLTSGIKSIDYDKTLVKCEMRDPPEPFSVGSIDVKIDKVFFDDKGSFDYKGYFFGHHGYEIKNILSACNDKKDMRAFSSIDIYIFQRNIEIFRSEKDKSEKDRLFERDSKLINSVYDNEAKARYLDFSIRFFDIVPQYTYLTFFKYFVVTNITIAGIFELLRRIFYYIILGRLRPPKTEQSL